MTSLSAIGYPLQKHDGPGWTSSLTFNYPTRSCFAPWLQRNETRSHLVGTFRWEDTFGHSVVLPEHAAFIEGLKAGNADLNRLENELRSSWLRFKVRALNSIVKNLRNGNSGRIVADVLRTISRMPVKDRLALLQCDTLYASADLRLEGIGWGHGTFFDAGGIIDLVILASKICDAVAFYESAGVHEIDSRLITRLRQKNADESRLLRQVSAASFSHLISIAKKLRKEEGRPNRISFVMKMLSDSLPAKYRPKEVAGLRHHFWATSDFRKVWCRDEEVKLRPRMAVAVRCTIQAHLSNGQQAFRKTDVMRMIDTPNCSFRDLLHGADDPARKLFRESPDRREIYLAFL